jgi:hypothetical protein
MGVRSLYDPEENMTALYCSTSGLAFGPTLGGDVGNEFCDFVAQVDSRDLRMIPEPELSELAARFEARSNEPSVL